LKAPELTLRERQILLWVFHHQPTTVRETAAGVGLRSSGTVMTHVRRLVRLGLLGQYWGLRNIKQANARGLHTTPKVAIRARDDELYYVWLLPADAGL